MRSIKLSVVLIIMIGIMVGLVMLATPQKAVADNCSWIGGTGNWSVLTNWSCGKIPAKDDAVVINNGGTVTLDMNVTVKSLTLTESSTLGGSNAITVTHSMDWSNRSSMVGSGATNIASGATLLLTVGWGNYGNHYPILDTRTLNIAGTAILTSTNVADSYSRLGMFNGATINISGLLDFQSNTGIAQDNGATGNLNNSGFLRKSGGTGASPITGVHVNNTGTVQALSGTLSLAGGGTSSGSFFAAAGATLDFGGGTQTITLDPSSSFSGAGSVSFSGGTTSIGGSGTYAMAGGTSIYSSGIMNMNLNGTTAYMTITDAATLGGSNAITVTHSMDWSNRSSMVGSGATNIASGATLLLTVGWGNYGNHYPVLDTRSLNIAGTAILTSTNVADSYSRLGMFNGATINITGLLDFQSNTGIAQDNGAAGNLNNSGFLRKSGGTGASPITGVHVNNTGTVQALSGTLSLAGGGTSSGSFFAAAGATLDFGGGTQTITLDPSSSFSGAGSVSFSGGTTSIGGSGTYAMAGGTSIYSSGIMNMNLNGTTAYMTITDAATLGGSNAITVTHSMDWSNRSSMVGSGATNIASGATLLLTVGWGNYGNHYPILDTRTLNIAGTAILTSTNVADSYSRLGMFNGATINISGLLDFQSNTGIAQDNGAMGNVNNSGILRKSGGNGTSPIYNVLVNNYGSVQALSGTLSFTNFTQTSGVTMLNGGSLAGESNPLSFTGGTLQGVGNISGNVNNSGGTVSPGNSAATLHISGNYTQGPTGKLNVELGGVITGTQYDVLDVTGSASLDGELAVSLINGYLPITGTIFTIMNCNVCSGEFITETGTNVGGYLFLHSFYTSNHVKLIASTAVADLSVSITDGKSYAATGDPITYTIVIANAGPDLANGVMVTDTLPTVIGDVTWTCVASDGSCNAPDGSGNIRTTVNLEVGGIVTITISGRLSLSTPPGILSNTVTISHPADPNPANNNATDNDVILYVKMYIPIIIK